MPSVAITQAGRSGSVSYRAPGGVISGWWEFAGGDAIAIVYFGREAEWGRAHAWALPEREKIFEFVANEVIRQQCAGCMADIDLDGGWITIRRAVSTD